MRYGSVCSGIEAASVAWESLGWEPAWFAEIEPFPSAVLAHHFPSVPNLGDFTAIGAEHGPVDLLVGGTPCQSFSIAGLRGGLDDERGNLALEYLRLAQRVRPRWLVWENVPGVLSSNGGRDFGAILGGMVELGYGVAYRVLDAQFFGVPQRRRRVFVVGCLGNWRAAAAVLFEPSGLRGDSPPSRAARKEAACASGSGTAVRGWQGGIDRAGVFGPEVSPALKARDYKGPSSDGDGDGDGAPLIAHALRAQSNASNRADSDTYVTHSLRGEGFDASEDGTGRGTPLVPVCFDEAQITSATNRSQPAPGREAHTLSRENAARAVVAFSSKYFGADAGPISPTLRASGHTGSHANGGAPPAVALTAHAFDARQSDVIQYGDRTGPLDTDGHSIGVQTHAAVRRLTPRECERLQGFPDDHTLIPWRKGMAPDGPRYKAIGNSMAVPVMRWIGERIQHVDAVTLPIVTPRARAAIVRLLELLREKPHLWLGTGLWRLVDADHETRIETRRALLAAWSLPDEAGVFAQWRAGKTHEEVLAALEAVVA